MKRIILVTSSPAKSGLAYFHYLAFRDTPGISVEILDNGQATYGRTFTKKVGARIRRQFNIDAGEQYKALVELIGDTPGQTSVVFYGMACLSSQEICKLNAIGAKLYAYLSDSPAALSSTNWLAIKYVLPVFNCVFCPTSDAVPVYYQNGASKVVRIPFGYCRYTHLRANSQIRNPDGKLYYFGTYGALVEEWLAPLLKFPLVIHGHDWGNAKHRELRKAAKHPIVLDASMADLASGQLVVNFMRTQHGGCHSMKTFEMPAAGACVISNRTDEQVEFFPANSCANYFNTAIELDGLVSGYITNTERITNNIALREQYLEGQSYHDRVKAILKELDDTRRH